MTRVDVRKLIKKLPEDSLSCECTAFGRGREAYTMDDAPQHCQRQKLFLNGQRLWRSTYNLHYPAVSSIRTCILCVCTRIGHDPVKCICTIYEQRARSFRRLKYVSGRERDECRMLSKQHKRPDILLPIPATVAELRHIMWVGRRCVGKVFWVWIKSFFLCFEFSG